MNTNEKIVKEDIVKFLLLTSIGSVKKDNWIDTSIKRAYLDFCRTMTYKKEFKKRLNLPVNSSLSKDQEKDMKDQIEKYYQKCSDIICPFLSILETGGVSQKDFDKEHNYVCKQLIEVPGFSMNYGQAQKWLNMAIKYLFIYEEMLPSNHRLNDLVEVFHVPIDNVVLDLLSLDMQSPIQKPKVPWSKWDAEEYIKYKRSIDNSNLLPNPFLWELANWIPLEEV